MACSRASLALFFKRAYRLGLVSGAGVKSDLGLANRRTTSGELHGDRCPILFFAMPCVNEHAATLSDMAVYVNLCVHVPVTASGKVRYLGPQPAKALERNSGRRTLTTIEALRCKPPAASRAHLFTLSCYPRAHIDPPS